MTARAAARAAGLSAWWMWASCAPSDPTREPDDSSSPPEEPGPTAHTGASGPTAGDPCAPDPSVAVAAEPRTGELASQVALDVSTGADATVAAWCEAVGDPEEAHLVESSTPARAHELRLLGLLPSTDYSCRVVAVCPTSAGPGVEVRFRAPDPPAELPVLQVEVDPELGATGAYTLAPWQGALGGADPLLVIWDAVGRPRWWWRLPEGVELPVEALLDRGTTRILWGGGNHPDGRPTVVDLWEGVVDRAELPTWGRDHYTHDAKRLPDGRVLSLLYVPNTDGSTVWQGFGVRIHDPATNRVEFEYDSQRLVDEGVLRPAAAGSDPYHANWVDLLETPAGPVLYVSLFGVQRILAIDGDDGSLLWDLGADQGWTVLAADGSSLDQEALPQGQHGLEVLGDDLLVYDNGLQRRESRASRWRIDPLARVATQRWVWTEPGWFEPITGDIDDLGGGRLWISKTHAGCCGQPIDLVEVEEATGRVASRITFPSVRHMSYRTERYGGCELFASAAACPELAERREALAPLFDASR